MKVLPEILFPFVGAVASFFVMPFTGDFIFSVTIVSALILSSAITLYIFLFWKFIRTKIDVSEDTALFAAYLFFLFHFFIFRGAKSGYYLFHAFNLTCVYHYLIPALLNFCLVLSMEINDTVSRLNNGNIVASDGLLMVALYLAIFSNIFCCIVLVSYISAMLLLKLLRLKSFSEIGVFCRQNIFSEAVLGVWFIALFYEFNGGRSAGIRTGFNLHFSTAWKDLRFTLGSLNRTFCAVILFFALVFLATYIYRALKQKEDAEIIVKEKIAIFCMMFFAVLIFAFLVSAEADNMVVIRNGVKVSIGRGHYLRRAEVLINIAFCFFVPVLTGTAYALSRRSKMFLICPFLAFYLTFVIFMNKTPLADTTVGNMRPSLCAALSRDIVAQVVAADEQNKKEAVILVPKIGWGHGTNSADNIARTLYRYGVISRNMKLKIQLDEERKEKYGL